MTNNILFFFFKQRAYVYIWSYGWRHQFSCSFLSGPPADDAILHVVFYPDLRLTAHIYKKFSSGSPADGSQRVKKRKCFIWYFVSLKWYSLLHLLYLLLHLIETRFIWPGKGVEQAKPDKDDDRPRFRIKDPDQRREYPSTLYFCQYFLVMFYVKISGDVLFQGMLQCRVDVACLLTTTIYFLVHYFFLHNFLDDPI